MERLTGRRENGDPYFKECFENPCNGNGTTSRCDDCVFLVNVCLELAHYEDMEEQGKLIELPCKPGDTVYAFRKNKIVEMVVTTVTIMKNSVMFGWETKEEFAMSPWLWAFEEKDIGTRVFLTEQEAKEALERIDK